MALLFTVEHLAFGHHSGGFLAGVGHASGLRRFISVILAGAVGGIGWYLLRRFTKGQSAEVDHAIWAGSGQLSVARSLGTSVISEIVVGMGASLGREAAPKLLGGTAGTVFAGLFDMTGPQRRLLVACGAGAGLACVYNVPLGAACFTAEILCGSIALPTVSPHLPAQQSRPQQLGSTCRPWRPIRTSRRSTRRQPSRCGRCSWPPSLASSPRATSA